MPERIQLRRSKGWRMPDNTLKVDRTTRWGNPFVQGKENPFEPGQMVEDRQHAVELYKEWAQDNAELAAEAKEHLRGKNLACWCAKTDAGEDACHAAVLLRLANG